VKVAFLSDIHANFPALCKALESARRKGARKILCAGDIVGLGPHPTEVVRLLVEEKVLCIRGNVDRKVAAAPQSPKKLAKRLKGRPAKASEAWAALNLGEAEKAWLAALPPELRLTLGGVDVWLVHGSPLSDADYIYPSLTERALAAKLGTERPGLLVCGHSHIPFTRKIGGVRVVNCGSAGSPVDGDPRGSYALCELSGGRAHCQIVRFAYPVQALLVDIAARKTPSVRGEGFARGTRPRES
jgi:putative phosphoesterase